MATQKGRNWSSGDIVTAANLGSIERGVSAVAEEYTPTTWANGDTVTAAALNNIEQGIVNASDFSTAEVTVTNAGIELIWDNCPTLDLENNVIIGSFYSENSSITVLVPLYKGKCFWERGPLDLILTGNIEAYEGGLLITGDCTITISSGGSSPK